MRVITIVALMLMSNIGHSQTSQSPLLVTRIPGITSSWAGECAAGVIDNRSQVSRQNDYHSFSATGSGSWTVTMQFSDVSCSGPWSSFGSQASITQASNPPIGYGNGYHSFIKFSITGAATASYSASKNYFLSASLGGSSFPCSVPQGCLGLTSIPLHALLLGALTSSPTTLTPGPSGTVLKSRGPSLDPAWSAGPTFNVIDYGATGDGVADDRSGIQAAIDAAKAAGGGVVSVPRGTYLLTSKHPSFPTAHIVFGQDYGFIRLECDPGTVIRANSVDADAIRITLGTWNGAIKGCTIDRTYGTTTASSSPGAAFICVTSTLSPTPPFVAILDLFAFGIPAFLTGNPDVVTVSSYGGAGCTTGTRWNLSVNPAYSHPSGAQITLAQSTAMGIAFRETSTEGAQPFWKFEDVTTRWHYDGVYAGDTPNNAGQVIIQDSTWINFRSHFNAHNGLTLLTNNGDRFFDAVLQKNGRDGAQIGGATIGQCAGDVDFVEVLAYRNFGNGFTQSGTGSQNCQNMFYDNVQSDTNGGHGLYVEFTQPMRIRAGSFSFNAKHGVYLSTNAREANITGLTSNENGWAGLAMDGGGDHVASGIQTMSNGQLAGHFGIELTGSVTGVTFSGLISGNGANWATLNRQTQIGGMLISGGAGVPAKIQVTNAQFPSNGYSGWVDNMSISGTSGSVIVDLLYPSIVAVVPACSTGLEGSRASFTDSVTATWGANITGAGGFKVLGYCNGSNWTVAAK